MKFIPSWWKCPRKSRWPTLTRRPGVTYQCRFNPTSNRLQYQHCSLPLTQHQNSQTNLAPLRRDGFMHDTTIKKVEAGSSPRGEMGQKYLVAGKPVSLRLWTGQRKARSGRPDSESESWRLLVGARRGHSPIHDHRTLHGFRSNCPTSRGAWSRRCLDGDSNLPQPDAFEPILVENLLPATQTTRFDLNSLGPATKSGACASEGGRYDPLEPEGRSWSPLHCRGYAGHLSQSKISETRRPLARDGRVRARLRSSNHFERVPSPCLGGRQ